MGEGVSERVQLSLDYRAGSEVSFEEISNPDRSQILSAVDRLDSKVHTEVSLKNDDPFEYLAISGGPDQFLVSGEARDGAFVQLRNPEAPTGKVELVCGGQSSEFDLHDVVTRDQVPHAVDQFFVGLSDDLPEPWSIE
jgi:hypothetical protein